MDTGLSYFKFTIMKFYNLTSEVIINNLSRVNLKDNIFLMNDYFLMQRKESGREKKIILGQKLMLINKSKINSGYRSKSFMESARAP